MLIELSVAILALSSMNSFTRFLPNTESKSGTENPYEFEWQH